MAVCCKAVPCVPATSLIGVKRAVNAAFASGELARGKVVAAGCCAVLSVIGAIALESWPIGAEGGGDCTIGCKAAGTTMVVIGDSVALRICLRGAGGLIDGVATGGLMESPAGTTGADGGFIDAGVSIGIGAVPAV